MEAEERGAEVAMPVARPVPEGRTLILDRRTTRRFFLLRPDGDRSSQRLFMYCLAVFAAEHGIRVHGFIQMSSHFHLCLTDVRGVLPQFLAAMHGTLAMGIKGHRRWDEEVWNKSQTSVLDLETPDAIVEQLAYLITNGIEAGMVETPEAFPGAITQPEQIGRWTLTIKRPDVPFFGNAERWPATASLKVEMPPLLEAQFGATKARRTIRDAVDQRAESLRRERKEKGLGYIGAHAVCSAPINTTSTKSETRRSRKPTFAVGANAGRETYLRKVREIREWRTWYAESLARWKSGDRDVIWPPDTWKMRVLHNVPCASSA